MNTATATENSNSGEGDPVGLIRSFKEEAAVFVIDFEIPTRLFETLDSVTAELVYWTNALSHPFTDVAFICTREHPEEPLLSDEHRDALVALKKCLIRDIILALGLLGSRGVFPPAEWQLAPLRSLHESWDELDRDIMVIIYLKREWRWRWKETGQIWAIPGELEEIVREIFVRVFRQIERRNLHFHPVPEFSPGIRAETPPPPQGGSSVSGVEIEDFVLPPPGDVLVGKNAGGALEELGSSPLSTPPDTEDEELYLPAWGKIESIKGAQVTARNLPGRCQGSMEDISADSPGSSPLSTPPATDYDEMEYILHGLPQGLARAVGSVGEAPILSSSLLPSPPDMSDEGATPDSPKALPKHPVTKSYPGLPNTVSIEEIWMTDSPDEDQICGNPLALSRFSIMESCRGFPGTVGVVGVIYSPALLLQIQRAIEEAEKTEIEDLKKDVMGQLPSSALGLEYYGWNRGPLMGYPDPEFSAVPAPVPPPESQSIANELAMNQKKATIQMSDLYTTPLPDSVSDARLEVSASSPGKADTTVGSAPGTKSAGLSTPVPNSQGNKGGGNTRILQAPRLLPKKHKEVLGGQQILADNPISESVKISGRGGENSRILQGPELLPKEHREALSGHNLTSESSVDNAPTLGSETSSSNSREDGMRALITRASRESSTAQIAEGNKTKKDAEGNKSSSSKNGEASGKDIPVPETLVGPVNKEEPRSGSGPGNSKAIKDGGMLALIAGAFSPGTTKGATGDTMSANTTKTKGEKATNDSMQALVAGSSSGSRNPEAINTGNRDVLVAGVPSPATTGYTVSVNTKGKEATQSPPPSPDKVESPTQAGPEYHTAVFSSNPTPTPTLTSTNPTNPTNPTSSLHSPAETEYDSEEMDQILLPAFRARSPIPDMDAILLSAFRPCPPAPDMDAVLLSAFRPRLPAPSMDAVLLSAFHECNPTPDMDAVLHPTPDYYYDDEGDDDEVSLVPYFPVVQQLEGGWVGQTAGRVGWEGDTAVFFAFERG